jgi:hypothetical protein
MKLNVPLTCLIFLLVLTTLLACTDHLEVQPPARFRLKKTIETSAFKPDSKDTSTTTYTYNAEGYLINEVTVETNTFGNRRYVRNSTFVYNDQNKLTRIDKQINANPAGHVDYLYDSDGHIIAEILATDTTVFTYNGSRLPATVANRYGKTAYTYANGNVIQAVFTPADPKQALSTTTYQYDDKPNPDFGVIRSTGFSTASINKNNVISYSPSPANAPQQLRTYNANGLLTSLALLRKPEYNYDYSQYFTFEYEAY